MSTAAITTSTRHVVIDSPIGPLTLVRDDHGLTGLYYPGHWTRPDKKNFGPRVEPSDDHGFDAAIAQLQEYFAGDRREFDLPLNPHGSETAQKVWQLLAEIPTVRPRRTVRWPSRSVAASTLATSAASSATTRCRSSSRAIALWGLPASSPGTPAAWTASSTCSSWRRLYPLRHKHFGSRHEAALRKRRLPPRFHRAAGGAGGPRPRRR